LRASWCGKLRDRSAEQNSSPGPLTTAQGDQSHERSLWIIHAVVRDRPA
jgi:hypothetical protein